jgi:DNA-binding NarL/FixJ family response regulator
MEIQKVLLIDSHAVVREGIKAVLSQQNEWIVAGEATDVHTAVNLAETLRPDLVITDIRLHGIAGIEAVEKIKRILPKTRFIAFSAHFTVISIQQAIEAGITGFVQKDGHCDELLKAIKGVMQDNHYFGLKVRQLIASNMHKILSKDNQVKPWDLSIEEVEIVRMLTDGSSVNHIAFLMKKNAKTVDAKKRKIMNKLGFESLSKLTKYAIHQGITSLDY